MQRLTIILGVTWLLTIPALAADLTEPSRSSGKPAEHAVVWLEVALPPAFMQTSKVVLDQRNLSFAPQVLVVRVGTTVDFPNNDKVFHNVFSFRDGKKFDLGMYPTGTSKRIVFDKPGLARLFCNIHPNMAAYVMAVDTPYLRRLGRARRVHDRRRACRHLYLPRVASRRSAADRLHHGRRRAAS